MTCSCHHEHHGDASQHSHQVVKCPQCGQPMTAVIHSVITPGSQELRQLANGTLNCQTCGDCGAIFVVQTQLIYKDPDIPCIIVLETEEEGDNATVEKFVDCLATDAAVTHETARPITRLVYSREQFLEKIFLLAQGYDDRMIEYAKYMLFQGGAKEVLSCKRHRLLLDFSNQDKTKLMFILFDRKTRKPVNKLEVPVEEYDKLCAEFSMNPSLQEELERIFPGCRVEADYIFERGEKEK